MKLMKISAYCKIKDMSRDIQKRLPDIHQNQWVEFIKKHPYL
jgi:hypothetical protein